MNFKAQLKVGRETYVKIPSSDLWFLLDAYGAPSHVLPKKSLLCDTLDVLVLYEEHYECVQGLRKTQVRGTFEMLLTQRNSLAEQIEANKK